MFNGPRFLTVGIQSELSLEIQIILWTLIDNLKNEIKELDYLQVFELTPTKDDRGRVIQQVVHRQECPPYNNKHGFATRETCNAKIFVIDDKTHTTMLLASEY